MNKKKESTSTKTKLHKGMLLFYCACALVLLGAFGLMAFRMVLKSQLNAKLDEIRAAGYSATLAELNDYYSAVPNDENAALLYEKAFALYRDTDDKNFEKDVNGKPYPKQNSFLTFLNGTDIDKRPTPKSFFELVIYAGAVDIAVVGEHISKAVKIASQQYLDGNQDAIKMLKQATKYSKCQFPVDFCNISYNENSYLVELRQALRLYLISARLAAEDGNVQLVTNDILTMFKFCHTLGNAPTMSAYKINLGNQCIVVGNIEYILSLIELDDKSLSEIGNALEILLVKQNKILQRVFTVDKIMQMDLNEQNAKYNHTEPIYLLARFTGILTLNQLKVLTIYKDILALDKSNIKVVNRYEIKLNKQLEKMSHLYIFAKLALQGKFSIIYQNFTLEAQIKVAITGIAIERYRLKYHKLPGKLTKLVPEFIKKMPNDPFTGKPFRYVVSDIELEISEGKESSYPASYKSKKIVDYSGNPVLCIKRPGWMVYSFGKDQDDDNGADNGDIPFRCVRKLKNNE